MKQFGGNYGPPSNFGWMDSAAGILGMISTFICVMFGFWAIFAMIFGFKNPQDVFGVRRVRNCAAYVKPGETTVDCSQRFIEDPDGRPEPI